MSIPPDQFDENGEPIEPEQPEEESDEQFVAWRAIEDPPEWFYDAGDILGELEARGSVNLNIDPYNDISKDGDITTATLHGYDEDTGEDLYWTKSWTKDEWMDFYFYTLDFYDDEGFWSEDYTPDML